MSDMLPTDTHVMHPIEVKRLAGQNAQILGRLEQGPASRRQLTEYACNVTARISDLRVFLRTRGLTIQVDEKPNGYSEYRIVELSSPSGMQGHDTNAPIDGRLI
jgi:hypothetical protein